MGFVFGCADDGAVSPCGGGEIEDQEEEEHSLVGLMHMRFRCGRHHGRLSARKIQQLMQSEEALLGCGGEESKGKWLSCPSTWLFVVENECGERARNERGRDELK